MGDDYIDELNWYTDDFVDPPPEEKKKRKNVSGDDGEKRKRYGETSEFKPSGLIDVMANQQKRVEGVSVFNRAETLPKPGGFVFKKPETSVFQKKSEGISVFNRTDEHKRIESSSIFSRLESESIPKKAERFFSKPESEFKKEGTSVFNRPDKKTRSREVEVEVPARRIKLDKPDREVFSISKSKENNPILFNQPKIIAKKSDFSEVPSKVDVRDAISNFVKAPINSKAVQALTEKLALLEERDKLIRSSLEKPSNLKQAIAVKGTCPDMCPEKERIMRSLKKMVHVFECGLNSNEMDPKLAVKDYTRSSADQEEPLPHELRPEPVLTMSMSYIITQIISKFEDCDDVAVWYDFCWNRLRAIRKDIVQQQLCDLETATILEQCARFHIVCFDRFWGLDSTIFDEKINTENLMNCLKILLNCYGDLRKQGIVCPNEPEFNAYMILIKMNSGDILWEFLNFPLSLQQTPEVIEAVKIHMFYNSNMYSQFFNYLVNTTYLNACLMQRCFTLLRVRALEAIVKAYCPPGKEGKVSLQHIMKSLKFDNKEDALEFCKTCNVKYIERSGFKISHATFVRPEAPLKVSTPSSLVCIKRVDFAQAVVGLYNDMPIFTEHEVHNSFLDDNTLSADALDASDQEEKMLRDNVKRKLLLKSFKNSPTKENISHSQTPLLQRSLSSLSNRRKSLESDSSSVVLPDKFNEQPYTPEPEEMDDEMSESEDYDMPDAGDVFAQAAKVVEDSVQDDYEEVYEDSDEEEESVADSDSQLPVGISGDVSLLSAISEESEDEDQESEPSKSPITESPHSSSPEPPQLVQQVPKIIDIPITTKPTDFSLPKISPVLPVQKPERRLSVSAQKESKVNPYLIKLRSVIHQNMQRISAKKYGRIWRDKVREIRKSYGFIPLVSRMNLKEYIDVWGHSLSNQSSIWSHLNSTKKLSSSVDSLLLFNLFDTSFKRLGESVCQTLVSKRSCNSRVFTPSFDSSRSGPIYWKLVFSVPHSKVSTYDLYEEVRLWSEEVFFSTEVAKNTHIETVICKGIKVYCKVEVVEGDRLDCGKNLSALVFLRVPGWESHSESQSRLGKLISLSNHPIPVCVINLTSCPPLTPSTSSTILNFTELTAGSTKFPSILTTLASNSYQLTVKSLHVCDLMCELLDKFLDALQEDCYHNKNFLNVITDPSNIVHLYNVIIDKIKNEIIHNYKTNIFGTANEIISAITPNSKYPANSIGTILSEYFDSLILTKLKWPPVDSRDVLFILKNYCDKSGIPQILSHVIRLINPPDDDDDGEDLAAFLSRLNWLQIMEVIIKGHFRTKFCDVIITYSEKSVNNFIDSHWWMECGSILKYK